MADRALALRFLALAIAGFALTAILNAKLFGLEFEIPPAIFAGFFGVGMAVLSTALFHGQAREGVAALGRMSMTIYILHILAGAGTRIVLAKLGFTSVGLHIVAGTLAGIFLPVLAHLVFARMGLLVALGLKAPVRKVQPASA